MCKYIWATSWQNQQNDCAPSEDSDQPGHPPSLTRVFAVRMKKAWVLSYPLSAQQRLWSLSLRWAHMPFCWFCHEAAHIFRLKAFKFWNKGYSSPLSTALYAAKMAAFLAFSSSETSLVLTVSIFWCSNILDRWSVNSENGEWSTIIEATSSKT